MSADSAFSWKKKAPAKNGILADFYSRQELADELGVTLRSLERWAWLRKGPPRTKIGNRVYYHRNAVESWLKSQTEGAL
jgi:hypothetical protein